jgi:hypothetical protein
MGPTGPTGPKGDKGDVGDFDATKEKQLILVDKTFGNVTYPHAFQTFEFVDSGTDAPYNGHRGLDLVVTKSATSETVPILGSRAPIKITQESNPEQDDTGISIVTNYSQAESYGVIFAIRDHINSGVTKTVLMFTNYGSNVNSSAPVRRLGTVDRNRKTYEYYLGRVDKNTNSTANPKSQFVFEILYTSADLPKKNMAISVYGDLHFYSYPLQIIPVQISQTGFIFRITKTLKGKNSKVS